MHKYYQYNIRRKSSGEYQIFFFFLPSVNLDDFTTHMYETDNFEESQNY